MMKVLGFILAVCMAFSEQAVLTRAVETGEIVRLHVIAAGDSAEEQRVKLVVRDAILDAFGEALGKAQGGKDALKLIADNLDAIERVATLSAREEGYQGPVRAMVGVYDFPDRDYEGVIVPAGEYNALRIVLGEGAGQNWWCVLYPALCLATSSKEPVEDAEIEVEWQLTSIFAHWF